MTTPLDPETELYKLPPISVDNCIFSFLTGSRIVFNGKELSNRVYAASERDGWVELWELQGDPRARYRLTGNVQVIFGDNPEFSQEQMRALVLFRVPPFYTD